MKHGGKKTGKGKGSRAIMFDLYGCDKQVMVNRTSLRKKMIAAISSIGMVIRKTWVDPWENGALTFFASLAESHLRFETWPDDDVDGHVNAEVQLCHYSRNNSSRAWKLTQLVIETFQAQSGKIVFINRGPGPDLEVVQEKTFVRKGAKYFYANV